MKIEALSSFVKTAILLWNYCQKLLIKAPFDSQIEILWVMLKLYSIVMKTCVVWAIFVNLCDLMIVDSCVKRQL